MVPEIKMKRPSISEDSIKSQGSAHSRSSSMRGMFSNLLPSLNNSLSSAVSIDHSQSEVESDLGDSCSLLDDNSKRGRRRSVVKKFKSALGKLGGKGHKSKAEKSLLSSSLSSLDSSELGANSVSDPPTICERTPTVEPSKKRAPKLASKRSSSNAEGSTDHSMEDSHSSVASQKRRSSRNKEQIPKATTSFKRRSKKGSGSRLPARSKSYNLSHEQQGKDEKAPLQRASSFAARERQHNATLRGTPAPPPIRSSSRRNMNPAITDRRQLSHRKRHAGMTRAQSFHGRERDGRRVPERSRSSTHLGDSHGRRRSRSSSRTRKNSNETSSSALELALQVVCRHGEALGECCYEQAKPKTKRNNQTDSRFEVEDPQDDVSIDNTVSDLSNSLSSFLVKSTNKPNGNVVEELRKDDTINRSRSRSRSQSRTREPELELRPDAQPRRKRSNSRTPRQRSVSRGRQPTLKTHSQHDRSATKFRQRSTSRHRSSSKVSSNRGRSKSVSRRAPHNSADRSSSRARRSSSQAAQNRSRSASRARRERDRKRYETLSKEDIHGADPGRRPRSLSRSRRNAETSNPDPYSKHRVSRSLSRSREKSADKHEGIGNYLSRQTPELKRNDESNSQTTGSNTTGSNEISYKTPSYLWGSNNGNQSSNSSFSRGFTVADKKSKSISDDSARTETTTSSGYEYDTSTSTLKPQTPVGNGKPSAKDMNNNNGLLHVSMSSLSLSATPVTKAKHYYGKVVQKEEQILRSLVDRGKEPTDKNGSGGLGSLYGPLDH